MYLNNINKYSCPQTGENLFLRDGATIKDNKIFAGILVNESNTNEYLISDGIPNFIYPKELPESDLQSLNWYAKNADTYDEYLPLTFMTFNEDELGVREKMISLLNLSLNSKVLEIGCGTGRDSELIANKLGESGELFMQDISESILRIALEKISKQNFQPSMEFSLSNGYYLPFQDKYFDATFHFGGLNTFGDIKRALAEMVRVTKVGGKIVVGDENMPVWLRNTEFGKVLMKSNPHYEYNLPLEYLPIEARNVKIEWVVGGVFYIIDFVVGEGEPYANFDFEIPGERGGTHRTRYYGQLEGVTQEAKDLAYKAKKASGESMHKWLDRIVKEASRKELKLS